VKPIYSISPGKKAAAKKCPIFEILFHRYNMLCSVMLLTITQEPRPGDQFPGKIFILTFSFNSDNVRGVFT
jgi:hypothetical protein